MFLKICSVIAVIVLWVAVFRLLDSPSKDLDDDDINFLY